MKLSQQKLEEMVVGSSPNPNAIFYEHAALNVPKSKEAGHRVYDKKTYILLSNSGIADKISYEAQKADIANYPDEYEYFLQNKQGTRALGIEIIPKLDIAHLQELRDCGILTIPKLAEMEIVPPHLEYAHQAAKVFNQALQETTDALEEDNQKVEDVHQADRQEHIDDVGRRGLPEGGRNPEAAESPKRDGAGGRLQRNNPISSNWSMSF